MTQVKTHIINAITAILTHTHTADVAHLVRTSYHYMCILGNVSYNIDQHSADLIRDRIRSEIIDGVNGSNGSQIWLLHSQKGITLITRQSMSGIDPITTELSIKKTAYKYQGMDQCPCGIHPLSCPYHKP